MAFSSNLLSYLRSSVSKTSKALEINRSLLLEDNKIYVVRDSILDVIDVSPVYFSDKKVVLKNVPNGETIIAKPVAGAYIGMLVKIYGTASSEKSTK